MVTALKVSTPGIVAMWDIGEKQNAMMGSWDVMSHSVIAEQRRTDISIAPVGQ